MFRSRQSQKLVTGLLLLLTAAVPIFAQNGSSDQLLKMIPSDALFCIRINNFDYSLSQTDQFIAGVSPMPMGVSMLVRMQLAQFLGNPQLTGLNTNGNFAVFGVVMPSNTAGSSTIENMFFGILAPVTDYQQLISGSPNLSEPDENGISKITQNGSPSMLATQIGSHVLLSQAGEYEKFASAKKTFSANLSKNLASALDNTDTKMATTEPIWIYGNVQQASGTFGPMILAKIEEIKNMFGSMPANRPGMQPQNIKNVMNMYAGILEIFMKEAKSVSIAINPKPNVLNITKTITAVPGTDMANMFVANTSTTGNKLLGFLNDGAMMNMAGKMNTPFMKTLNVKGMDILFSLSGDDLTEENKAKTKAYFANWTDCLGDSMVVSVSIDPEKKPPFEAGYVISIKDKNKYNSLIDEMPEMMKTSGMLNFYKDMGMETSFEIKRAVKNYKGVSIDSAKLMFKSAAPDSPQGQIIQKMYGDGFDYRWGIVNDVCVMTIGGDSDTAINTLIDKVQAGVPNQTAAEIKSAMALLPQADKADFLVTYNVIRLFKMITSMAPVPMPQVNAQSQSNIAIAGKADNGKMVVNIAVPKEHLTEIMSLFMMMQMQHQQQNNNTMN